MVVLYRIRNWSTIFENNRSRELKRMEWVPVPNRHDGDGFTDLLSRDNGIALFGAWVLMLQVASKCDDRGTLARQNPAGGCDDVRLPHTAESLARITRCPVDVMRKAITVCLEIGWIEAISMETQEIITIPHNPAPDCGLLPSSRARDEGNGTEGNGTEQTHGQMGFDLKSPERPDKKPKRGKRLEYSAEFEVFWNAYPHPHGKEPASRAYRTAIERGATQQQMLAAIARDMRLPKWQKGIADRTFDGMPHAATWLNDNRYATEKAIPTTSLPWPGMKSAPNQRELE